MNFEQARSNMVEQQIRPWNVLDQRVLDLLATTPREQFVPQGYRDLAFCDTRIPLDHGECMMTPKVEARMLQTLAVQPGDQALEIGTGSGYVTALLANSCQHVVSVEIHADLSTSAGDSLTAAGINNVTLEVGDGVNGWPSAGPYDVIAITGSMHMLPNAMREQLKPRGRLFAIMGDDPVMEAWLVTRIGDNEWSKECLFETSIRPLTGAQAPERFVL